MTSWTQLRYCSHPPVQTLGKAHIGAAVCNYRIAMQPSLYLAQAALLTLLHRKDILGAFGSADLITWTSNVTLVTGGAIDCVFVEELAGIDAVKNDGILSNPFNLLSSQHISRTNSPPTSSRCRALSSPLPPLLSSPSSVVETVIVVIIVIVAAARCLCPIQPPTAPRVTPPSPLQVLNNAPRDEVQCDVDGRKQLVLYVAFGFAFGPKLVDGCHLTHQ